MKKASRGLIFIVMILSLVLLVRTPSNDRQWRDYHQIMSDAQVTVDEVTLANVRDWRHSATSTYSRAFIDQVSISPSDIKAVWFSIQPFAAIEAIGHTMLTFELHDGEAYTFSIEARREFDEEYSSVKGLLREYELFYSWGTARDFLGVRLFLLKDDLYHYPLQLTSAEAWQLLRYVAAATADIYEAPRFYNTATANCTNLLAKAINRHSPTTKLPYGLAWNLPGLSDQYLQKHGYISATYDIEQIRSRPGLQFYIETLQSASRQPAPQAFTNLLQTVSYQLVDSE